MMPRPEVLEFAWANAAPGREGCGPGRGAFQPCPLSGKPDIEPTPPNDGV
jgi:hypothetical protein